MFDYAITTSKRPLPLRAELKMFRVDEVMRAGIFRRRVRLVAEADGSIDKLYGSGAGTKQYKTIPHRAKFTSGEAVTVKLPRGMAVKSGDLLSLDTLKSLSALEPFFVPIEESGEIRN